MMINADDAGAWWSWWCWWHQCDQLWSKILRLKYFPFNFPRSNLYRPLSVLIFWSNVMSIHLGKGQKGFPFDVTSDLVNWGGQLVDLLPDVWSASWSCWWQWWTRRWLWCWRWCCCCCCCYRRQCIVETLPGSARSSTRAPWPLPPGRGIVLIITITLTFWGCNI